MLDFEIDVETFLFGGTCGDPYNQRTIDGWFCLDPKKHDSQEINDYDTFRKTIAYFLNDYCWNGEDCVTLPIEEFAEKSCQTFEMPDEDTIKKWWDLFISERHDLQEIE